MAAKRWGSTVSRPDRGALPGPSGGDGEGPGTALFEHARAAARAAGLGVLQIDADPNAEAFYLHMGAVRVGEVRSEIDGQPRVRPLLHLQLNG